MALYEYECKTHGVFEATHSINTKLEKCPQCEAEGVESEPPTRLISLGNFHLQGGGWASSGYS